MNISTRFTEFGMTGAFFWISQIIFFSIGYDQAFIFLQHYVELWKDFPGTLSVELKGVAGSLLTVFGVIGIFVTGLILDLAGSYFAPLEMSIFNRHIKRNQDWLNILSEKCPESTQSDYRTLRDDDGTLISMSPKKLLERLSMMDECRRIQTFMFSYIHVFSSMSGMLVDNWHLWRTSRAISTTLLILAMEFMGFAILSKEFVVLHSALLFALFGLSALITLSSYSRLCISLFGLACATWEKNLPPE